MRRRQGQGAQIGMLGPVQIALQVVMEAAIIGSGDVIRRDGENTFVAAERMRGVAGSRSESGAAMPIDRCRRRRSGH